jgi:nitrogen fixation protein FixH
MTTLTTLLGSVLLMLVLYGALGWLARLPIALRAVLATSLSLLAYFMFTVGRWPGLDVVAIHISILVAIGLLLGMFTHYRRHRVTRLHWGPKILIGFFVLLAMINSFLLYISTRGLPPALAHYMLPGGDKVNSGFSGVVTHGEDAAKAVSSELSRSHSAAQLGWHIQIQGLQETAQVQQRVTLKVLDRTGLPVSGLQAELQLTRPGAAYSQAKVSFIPEGVGQYTTLLEFPSSGRWLVDLYLSQHTRVVYRESREVTVP